MQNGATLTTPYLSLSDPNAIMTVSSADIVVPSLGNQVEDDDTPITDTGSAVAGVSIDGGILTLENSSTHFSQAGNAASEFVLDDSTATFDGDPDGLNGFALYDGSATWRDQATISVSQIYVGEPIDPNDTLGPSPTVLSSTIVITGAQDVPGYSFAGLWLADGQTDITNSSTVFAPGPRGR